MPTPIALTFDIEFDINGALKPPFDRRPRGIESLGVRTSQSELGLGAVLSTLREYGVPATFFVESLQSAWFGDREMGEVAERIVSEGHEVQLHLHPVWLLFKDPDWQSKARRMPPKAATHDALTAMPAEQALATIELARRAFERWDVPPPTAIRTGGLRTERPLYPLFREAGFRRSSSIGVGLHQPSDPSISRYTTPLEVDGVLELPVGSYHGSDPLLRPARRLSTLVGMGLREQRALLDDVLKSGASALIVLSHMSEFFSTDRRGRVARRARVERRLREFCGRLNADPALAPVTIEQLAGAVGPALPLPDVCPVVSRLSSWWRFTEVLAEAPHRG